MIIFANKAIKKKIMSSTNQKTLVPIGFTNQSIVALQQAVVFAKKSFSDIVLLTVVELPSTFELLFSNFDEKKKEFEKKANEKLLELKEKYCQGVNVECIVATGKVYEKVIEVASLFKVDLIVLGTDGTAKNIKKKFIGSNAYKVVRSSNVPVITIKGKEIRKQCSFIALPLDLHKETREKVSYAIEYARLFNSTIRIFSASLQNNDDLTKNKLKQTLEQVNSFITSKGIKCSMDFIEVSPSENFSNSIVEYSDKIGADLLIIMTKDESNIELNFLGSNAQKVINKSDTPVMSIRPSIKKDTTSFTIQ